MTGAEVTRMPDGRDGDGAQSSTPLLTTQQLEVTYNHSAVAIQGVSVSVPDGAIVAILGSNGAGKTTTLRAISGFLPGDSAEISGGQVWFAGRNLTGRPPHIVANLGVCLVPERDKVFTTLSVDENLGVVPARGSAADRKRVREFIFEIFPVLAARRDQLAGYLSGGERQMLAISRSLLLLPRVLLADEISLGIAPALVGRLMSALKTISSVQRVTVLLVEQNAAAALSIAEYVYVMETGRIVISGRPEEVMEHHGIREFYLGLSEDNTTASYADVKQYRRRVRWLA